MLRMWKEDKSWTFQFNLNFRFEITSSLPTGRLYGRYCRSICKTFEIGDLIHVVMIKTTNMQKASFNELKSLIGYQLQMNTVIWIITSDYIVNANWNFHLSMPVPSNLKWHRQLNWGIDPGQITKHEWNNNCMNFELQWNDIQMNMKL